MLTGSVRLDGVYDLSQMPDNIDRTRINESEVDLEASVGYSAYTALDLSIGYDFNASDNTFGDFDDDYEGGVDDGIIGSAEDDFVGRVVEAGLTDQVLDDPQHAYTQLLVSSVLQA